MVRALWVASCVLCAGLAVDAPAFAQSGSPPDLAVPDDDDAPLVVDDDELPEPDDSEPEEAEPEPEPEPTAPDAGVVPDLPEPDQLERGVFEDAGTAPVEAEPPPPPRRPRPLALPETPSPDAALPTEQSLAAHVDKRAAHLRAGSLLDADLELGLIEELRNALAARNVVVVSAQLIQESRVALGLGQTARAVERAEAAARLSPDLEAAHWMRARAYWAQDKAQIGLVLGALRDLLGARLGALQNQVAFLTLALTLLGLAFVATVVAFAFLQLVKHVRYPAYDLAKRVPGGIVGAGEVMLLLMIAVLLPFGAGLGLTLTLGLALAVVMPYQSKWERGTGLGLVVLLALAPLAVWQAAPLVSFHGSVVEAMADATSEAFADEAEARLSGEAKDYTSAMVIAHRRRQRGDLAGAEAAYRRALVAQKNDGAASNNLGTVLLLQGRPDDAETALKNAAAWRAGAAPMLNLSLLLAERGRFDESSAYVEQARREDPDLVAQQTALGASQPLQQKLVVVPLEEGLLWRRLFESGRPEAGAITQQVWRAMTGDLPALLTSLLVLVLGGLGFAVSLRADDLSTACPKCGLPASRHTQGQLCDQCTSVFLAATAIEPELKRAKERSVRRYQRRRRWSERLLSLAAGCGHILGGRPVLGLLFFFPFVLAVITSIYGARLAVEPWAVHVGSFGDELRTTVALVFVLVLGALALRSTYDR